MSARQRPPRIGFLMSQLGAHAAGLFADHVRRLGVTPSEAGVLRIVGRSPGISQRQLAAKLGATPSRVVVLVDGLEGKGFISRSRNQTDRRVHELDLTDQGRALLSGLRTAAEAQESALVGCLTPDQRDELHTLLSVLAAHGGLDPDVHPGYGDRPR